MKESRLLPNDPKLTAYVLGELTDEERAGVEAALRFNPALRRAVAEIRATIEQLETALADEAIFREPTGSPGGAGILSRLNGHAAAPAGRHAISFAHGMRREDDGAETYRVGATRSKVLRFPEFYYVVATMAAACFAVVFALRDPPVPRDGRSAATARQELVMETARSPAGESLAASDEGTRFAAQPEARVANVAPPPSNESPLESSATAPGQAAVPATVERSAPAFVEGDLTLLSQAGESEAPRSPSALAEQVRASSLLPTAEPGAPSFPEPLTAPTYSDAGMPSIPPPVAGSTLPSVVPESVPATKPSGSTLTVPNPGDVVVLSAFTVTADRAIGFATGGDERQERSDQRGRGKVDHRPFPPLGAIFGTETAPYSYVHDNDFVAVAHHPLSTFAADVDTASYANVKRILEYGSPPPRDAVRIEELLNYFPYRYAPPEDGAAFGASLEVADAPWAPGHRLVRIGLKAREVPAARRPPASLVFLLDVSGSMNHPNKLPLVQQSLRLLLGELRPDDRVAIVTYGGNSGLVLGSTPVAHSREILNALDALAPRGTPNGALGIQLAYETANAHFVRGGINRVILCTDGDFNVGATSEGELVRLVQEKTRSGVFLSVLGFGMGNLKDATLEKLADQGNGTYGYIDTRREAEKLLVEQVDSTLVTVARDVKIQVEFNPATVARYRLIGYENRLLRKEDFNRDAVDAGEVGAGHSITALYEIVPVGVESPGSEVPPVDRSGYAARATDRPRPAPPAGKRGASGAELLTVKVRYKKPDSVFSFPRTLEFPLLDARTLFDKASADFRFASAVAQFGMILRGSPHRGSATMEDVATWAGGATSPEDDPGGYRREFLALVRKAQAIIP